MRTRKCRTPSLRRHKPSSLSVVTLSRKDIYLRPWPEGQKNPPAEVQTAYDRLIAEWLGNGRRRRVRPQAPQGVPREDDLDGLVADVHQLLDRPTPPHVPLGG